jgi:hypothetical protein
MIWLGWAYSYLNKTSTARRDHAHRIATAFKNLYWLWLGWAYLTKKMPHAATMPIVTAVVCFLSTQNMGS